MPGMTIDGNDPLAVYAAVKTAHERAVNGEGPTLIEAMTHRLTAHSSDDNDRTYRDTEELETAKKNDSLIMFSAYLSELGILTEEIDAEMNQEIAQTINEATDYAEKAEFADPESILKFVYEE
jgi:2-oxoisovalerate dehydrogenase E1 component alpha subunit